MSGGLNFSSGQPSDAGLMPRSTSSDDDGKDLGERRAAFENGGATKLRSGEDPAEQPANPKISFDDDGVDPVAPLVLPKEKHPLVSGKGRKSLHGRSVGGDGFQERVRPDGSIGQILGQTFAVLF
jgi:hypothetical protein